MFSTRVTLYGFLLVGLLAGSAGLAVGQEVDPRGLQMTRADLETALERYEAASTSSGYSGSVREEAAREADLIRRRLTEGDFQVGDRISLRVQGEPGIPDMLTVEPGQVLRIPEMGEISLAGVLRSELQEHITKEIGRFIRDPVVTTEALVRVSIMGQVANPGFFVLPASMLFENALMAAGGPAGAADLEKIEIRRGQQVIWEGAAVESAIVEGKTLDQLSLRAGDRIDVPTKPTPFFQNGVIRTLIFTVPSVIFLYFRIRRRS